MRWGNGLPDRNVGRGGRLAVLVRAVPVRRGGRERCPHVKSQQHKIVARSPRGMAARPAPIAVGIPATASREA
ncbi:hypothetical protein ACRAWD_19525 [Caulobacter segnis]